MPGNYHLKVFKTMSKLLFIMHILTLESTIQKLLIPSITHFSYHLSKHFSENILSIVETGKSLSVIRAARGQCRCPPPDCYLHSVLEGL